MARKLLAFTKIYTQNFEKDIYLVLLRFKTKVRNVQT